jgi:HAD superfamily hydrolase (TIGR01549 family)
MALRTAILDIDGTLVDSNYQHAIAWYRAFAEHDVVVPIWRIHRGIGMGGDQLVAHLAGEETEERIGDALRESESRCYAELIDEVRPLRGAAELVRELDREGRKVVLASSAKEAEVEHYIDLLGVRDVTHHWTSSGDVERTKPAPDLVLAALEAAGGGEAVMVGDSVWDCEAAGAAGVPVVAVLTGGFSREELLDAGAVAVCDSLAPVRQELAGIA